jgi:predicted porin
VNTNLKLTAVSATALMLAAAPALAQTKSAAPTLALGGFYDQKISAISQDRIGYDSKVDVRNDVEIYFLGNVTLDNGIKISTRVELEGGSIGDSYLGSNPEANDAANAMDGGGFDQIDEAFMTIDGSFGSLKIGDSDTAPKGITTGLQGVWATHVGENVSFNAASKLIVRPSTVTVRATPAAQMDQNSDGAQISYTTPSMAGFQLSVAYAQNDQETYDGHHRSTTNKVTTDIWEGAVKYSGKFDNVAFNIGGGMAVANSEIEDADDQKQWMFGGNATFGAIKVGASFSRQVMQNNKGTAATIVPEVDTIELGAQYTMGANSFSAIYTKSDTDSRTAAQNGDSEKVVSLAWARSLGKGVTWHNTLFWVDQNDGDPAKGTNTENKGYALTTGLLVKF